MTTPKEVDEELFKRITETARTAETDPRTRQRERANVRLAALREARDLIQPLIPRDAG